MSWRGEYLSALRARDAHEHAQKEIYDACIVCLTGDILLRLTYVSDAKLADRSANLGSLPAGGSAETGPSTTNSAQTQADLIKAQKARGELSKRLEEVNEELGKLQVRSKDEGKQLAQLISERTLLSTKLKDRDEELRGKTRLINVCLRAPSLRGHPPRRNHC
jgi:peptidoglycan hydrolase CwlO-like protein